MLTKFQTLFRKLCSIRSSGSEDMNNYVTEFKNTFYPIFNVLILTDFITVCDVKEPWYGLMTKMGKLNNRTVLLQLLELLLQLCYVIYLF